MLIGVTFALPGWEKKIPLISVKHQIIRLVNKPLEVGFFCFFRNNLMDSDPFCFLETKEQEGQSDPGGFFCNLAT